VERGTYHAIISCSGDSDVMPGTMMTVAQATAEYVAACPQCGKACELAGHGRGRCRSCSSEFNLQLKLPACPECGSKATCRAGNGKHRCNQCQVVF
jgi:hypothetical protein